MLRGIKSANKVPNIAFILHVGCIIIIPRSNQQIVPWNTGRQQGYQ